MKSMRTVSEQKAQQTPPLLAAASVATEALDRVSLAGTFRVIEAAAGEGADGPAKKPSFELEAYNGGLMSLQWWPYPVVVDGKGIVMASQKLPIYLTHEKTMENLVGQSSKTKAGKDGKVTAIGMLTASRDSSTAYAQMLDHAAAGFEFQCSIEASVQQYEFCDAGKQIKVNGQVFDGPCYAAWKTTLASIAIVPLGADTSTKATLVANNAAPHGQEKTTMNFEQWIIAQGHDMATLSETQKTSLQAAYNSLQAAHALPAAGAETPATKPATTATPPVSAQNAAAVATNNDGVADLRLARAAEHTRIAAIEAASVGHPAITAQAIRENWTEDKTKLAVLQASRRPDSSGPAIHIAADGPKSALAIEAALCLSGRIDKPEKQFDAPTLEAAHKIGRIGLQEAIMISAQANGWQGRQTSSSFKANHKTILAAAFGMMGIQAGFSTVDISGILSNTANKFLLASFNAVEQVWKQIARINPVGDFKTITRYRLTSGGGYAKVGPDGELKHGTLSNESYTNKADTFGKMLTITRQDQYNDDLGALTQVPEQLGGDAGRALNTEFWTAFEDNASFFSAGHKNLVGSSGRAWYLLADPSELATMEVVFLDGRESPVVETAEADFNTLGIQMRLFHDFGCAKSEFRAGIMSHTALSLTALEAGEKLFNDQTFDAKGEHPVALTPRILLVATGDSVIARSLYKSTEVRDTTASTKAPVANVFEGMFTPVVSRYLSNS